MEPDIYYLEEYGKLNEIIEEGKYIRYVFKNEYGKVVHPFILREIDIDLEDDDTKYYDIITPYGYGGPIVTEVNCENRYTEDNESNETEEYKEIKQKLIKAYSEDFEKYAKDNNIVSEFVRFHPILKNHKDVENIYNVIYMRQTVGTSLDSDDPVQNEFSKSARKRYRRIFRDGFESEIIEKPENLDEFKKVYYETMDKNDAKDFYYFPDEYFDYLLKHLNEHFVIVNMKKDEEVLASGIYFTYKPFIHAHLSGTKKKALKYSPAYGLRGEISKWGAERKYKMLFNGGGTTNAEDDPLLEFKSRFTKEGFYKFYIGKKIYIKDVYDRLVDITNTADERFFPQYRAEKQS